MLERDTAAEFARARQRLANLAKVDPEIAGVTPDRAVDESLKQPGLSLVELVQRALTGYAERPALGSRAYEIRRCKDGRSRRFRLPAFEAITYGELRRRVEAIASAWCHHPVLGVARGEFACFIGYTSAELVTMDMACWYAQLIVLPLQANLPLTEVTVILGQTKPAVMIATIENLQRAADHVLSQASIRSLVVVDIDEDDDDERELLESTRNRIRSSGRQVVLTTFQALVTFGQSHAWQLLSCPPEGPKAMRVLMYTSGSTGTPKGAIVQEANCSEAWSASPGTPTVQLAYAPLNHLMGRNVVFISLADGGIVYFTLKSDMSTLFEDFRIARPTFVMFMPRVAEIIYHQYLSEVQRRVTSGEPWTAADSAVRTSMAKTVLGDRIVAGAVGGAPIAPEVQQFLVDCFNISFSESYGCTEAGASAIVTDGRIQRKTVIDYKLIDVPELGYYTTDQPLPRGELLVKSRLAISGYFKSPEATAQVFDDQGWLHTGDIMVERGPGRLAWLDRRHNVVKLSQAEYVAAGALEATFVGHSKLIRQIYVYGNSYRSYLLAVVVPDVEVARARVGHDPTSEELRATVISDLEHTARVASLKSFEVPRNVYIELEPFTHENGLLSSVRKPLRPKLKERYQGVLDELYQEMQRQRETELSQLRGSGGGISTLDGVTRALMVALERAWIDPQTRQSYRDLGGDSLGAASLSMLLEEIFGIAVPVSVLLGPMSSPASLALFIDAARAADGRVSTSFASVHGQGAQKVRAVDLRLPFILGSALLKEAEAAPTVVQETRCVLITGATGFLGRFLLLEWLEHARRTGGKVFALLRAADTRHGRARLEKIYGTFDRELAERFHAAAHGHLEVISGDFAAPRLGIDKAQFARLATEVDHVVHPGALVNHRLSYQNLFEPNVLGTGELLGLALTRRHKRFDFISTIGVSKLAKQLVQAPENTDLRPELPEMTLTDSYAAGYSISKWAGEILLREAHDRFGLPVTVYRPDMILPHAQYRGQINVPDMFTRLLFSLVSSGLAPWSFYEPAPNGGRARVHFEGTPVDFLAAAMRELSSEPSTGHRTFNSVSAHHEDGVSLDTVVDWVRSDGYAVDSLADYDEWLRRFTEKLSNLSAPQRERSSLSLIAHFERPQPVSAVKVRNSDFVEAVRHLRAGPEVPSLTEAYIHKYLEDMRIIGLLPKRV